MSGFLATALLDAIRNSMRVNIGDVQYVTPEGERLWQISAVNNAGERWIAAAPDYYEAALMLAELVGFDVMDG